MKKSVALLILIFMVSISAKVYAQVEIYFMKGTITLQTGEKKTGLIRNDENREMNFRIYFKETESQNAVVLDTATLQRVELENGGVFELAHFEPDKRMVFYDKVRNMRVLGQLLVEGWASLYKVQFLDDKYYIFKTPDRSYLLKDDKLELQSVSHNLFKNLLAIATEDAPAMKSQLKELRFSDKPLIAFTNLYNKEHQSEGKVYKPKYKAQHFGILMYNRTVRSSDKRTFFQAMYRIYFPSFSKGTSINFGFNHLNYSGSNTRYILNPQGPPPVYVYQTLATKGTLYTFPVQVQQNLLHGPVRPYVFIGIEWSHIQEIDEQGNNIYGSGYGENYGMHYMYGGGIEWNVFNGILLKTEYRFERIANPVFVGIGYCFSADKKSELGYR